MLKKIGKGILITLAVLGVLFIILMLLPEDEEDYGEETIVAEEDSSYTEEALIPAAPESSEEPEAVSESDTEEDENIVSVNIPQSDISDSTIGFTTVTLDEKTVTQDVFKDYDLTLVHVWGTFCGPCIAEMKYYGALEEELPSNINIIGIVNDVYDGLNYNVYAAEDILKNADASFTNLRVSDDLYNIVSKLQYVPSSFFVDREGHIVGGLMDGASYSETKAKLDSYLQ